MARLYARSGRSAETDRGDRPPQGPRARAGAPGHQVREERVPPQSRRVLVLVRLDLAPPGPDLGPAGRGEGAAEVLHGERGGEAGEGEAVGERPVGEGAGDEAGDEDIAGARGIEGLDRDGRDLGRLPGPPVHRVRALGTEGDDGERY